VLIGRRTRERGLDSALSGPRVLLVRGGAFVRGKRTDPLDGVFLEFPELARRALITVDLRGRHLARARGDDELAGARRAPVAAAEACRRLLDLRGPARPALDG
jgi:hypothetical protein